MDRMEPYNLAARCCEREPTPQSVLTLQMANVRVQLASRLLLAGVGGILALTLPGRRHRFRKVRERQGMRSS